MGKCYKKYYDKPKPKPEAIKDPVDDCVKNTIRKIIEAQDQVREDCCYSSCENSINQLRRPRKNHKPQNTTIPFILYCDSSCNPFIGSGVFQAKYGDRRGQNRNFFGSVETPIFRAKGYTKGSDDCVNLELLLPVTDECGLVMPETDGCCCGSISQFFPTDDPVTGFQATGICITVNLNKFLAITCLDPITPVPVNEDHTTHYSQTV